MRIEVPFATYEGESVVEQNSRETLINLFAEIEVSGRKKLIRRQRPGLASVLDIAGEKRCIERHKGIHFVVIGNGVYRYNKQAASLTSLGTIDSFTGRCTMIFNDNDEIMVSDGVAGYYYDGVSLQIVNSPVPVGNLAYQGGFGIFNRPDTGQFYITGVNDFSSVDALDFATAESYADSLVRPFVDHNELWLFGANSTEVWQLSGSADFPFARFTNAQLERGIGAAFSVAAEDNTVFWLGDDGVIYRADGYRPLRVSTHPVERAIQDLPEAVRASADAFIYTVGGHKFYTLKFGDSLTLQYNIATNFWNRARSFGSGSWHVMGSAGHHTEFYLTPTAIATLQPGLSTDEGEIIERGGISAPGYADGNRITVRSFYLDAEMGRAPIGQPSQVMLRVARDGETFGNERWRTLGATGQYRHRAMWRGLGQGRNWVFEFMFTDPTEFSVVGTHADVSIGPN